MPSAIPVPSAIPNPPFGSPAAKCTTLPSSGLYYASLVWTTATSPAQLSQFERSLTAAGFTPAPDADPSSQNGVTFDAPPATPRRLEDGHLGILQQVTLFPHLLKDEFVLLWI